MRRNPLFPRLMGLFSLTGRTLQLSKPRPVTTDSTDTCGIAVQPSQRENTTIDFMQSWALLKDSITRRFPEFDSEAFVIGVSEQEAVSESSIMASLSSCGAAVSAEELAIIAKECGCEIGPCFVSLMTFVKTTLKRETFVESEVSFGSLEETSIERFPALVSSSVAAMPPLVPSAAGIQQHGWLSRVAHIVKDGAVVAGAKLLHSGELASSIIVQGAQTAATSSVSALGFAVKSGVTAIAHVGDGASSAVVSSGKATSEVLIQRASTAGKRILTSASLAGSAVLESATKVGSAVACSSGAVIDVLRSVVTPTETCDSLSEEGSLKVNVTRKLTNEFYHSTMDAETVSIEVPSFLTGGWWTKFLEWFRSRQYTFDVTKFITSVGDAATISDNLLEDALKAAGVPITADSLEELKVHVWSGDTNVIIQTLRFIRKVVQLVGVATVEEDIIPAFNRKAAAKSDTTVTQITIRILKQIETDDGAVIVDSREETFDVPSIAFTGWWNKWSSDINGNYPSFGLTTFLSALGESDVVSDEIVLQALHAAGAPVSQDEVSLMKIDSESDSDSNSDSWSLFIFIRALIRVIGVEAVKQQVIPMFYESKCVRDGQSSVQSDDAEDGLSQIF
ncbi:hypothetical protein DFJ73DRAFT_367809 [Zopfochytrium polystomum]|nr:hypothetical protein DFJ73DRAFT_367809 [Zopfochytrium polystomum]